MVLPFDTKVWPGYLYCQQTNKFIATVESHYMGVVSTCQSRQALAVFRVVQSDPSFSKIVTHSRSLWAPLALRWRWGVYDTWVVLVCIKVCNLERMSPSFEHAYIATLMAASQWLLPTSASVSIRSRQTHVIMSCLAEAQIVGSQPKKLQRARNIYFVLNVKCSRCLTLAAAHLLGFFDINDEVCNSKPFGARCVGANDTREFATTLDPTATRSSVVRYTTSSYKPRDRGFRNDYQSTPLLSDQLQHVD
jgi:hypothetical protein